MNMKYNKILAMLGMVFALMSCERALVPYSETQNRLNFSTDTSTVNISFIYNRAAQRDTVWFDIFTQGFLSDQDRAFELEQVATGDNDAVPGKHYVAFTDPEVSKYLFIPSGAVTTSFPLIVLHDASLADDVFTLKFQIKENGNFAQAYPLRSYRKVRMTDMLTRPNSWGAAMNYYFGAYGPVKHQFMIDATGLSWDTDFCRDLVYDYGYVSFLKTKLDAALAEENAARAAQGLGALAEADGTIVVFS